MNPIKGKPCISPVELERKFEEAKRSKELDLHGFQFDGSTFNDLILFIMSVKSLAKIKVSKSLLSTVQKEQILLTGNKNIVKGLKLLDEGNCKLGSAYTDWHDYNMEKKDICRLHETTQKALAKFEHHLPQHVIDFGAGTGQETLELLKRGCPSVVAIDADYEAISILRERTREWLPIGVLDTYQGPFLDYRPVKSADLFIASYSWPYRPPADFEECWVKSLSCVAPGGWVAGHLFGPPEKIDPGMTYHTFDNIKELLMRDFDEFTIEEVPSHGAKIYGGTTPPWGSLYQILARKKGPEKSITAGEVDPARVPDQNSSV